MMVPHELFREAKIDVLIVSNLTNIRYLTGFTGSNALLALYPDGSTFWTDPRYALQSAREVGPRAKVSKTALLPTVAAYLEKRGYRRAGFEVEHLKCDQYQSLANKLKLVPVQGAVEKLRLVKTEVEIASIRRAVETNSAAFERALRAIKPGASESGVAAEIDYRMRRLGAEGTAFDTIVASGERSALPHAQPGPSRLKVNDLVLIDMGARRDGYTSDMTRMVFLGEPDRRVRKTYAAVLEAQLAAIDAIRPGVTGAVVDRAARAVLKKHGLDERFVHSTGHGLGLEIHEEPRIGRKGKTRLAAGMAVTVEPGVYLEGWGGIRIEDTVVVTQSGCEVLTPTPKRASDCSLYGNLMR